MFKILAVTLLCTASIHASSSPIEGLVQEVEAWQPTDTTRWPQYCDADMRYLTAKSRQLAHALCEDPSQAQVFNDHPRRPWGILQDMAMCSLIDSNRFTEAQRVAAIQKLWAMYPYNWRRSYDRRIPGSGHAGTIQEYLLRKINIDRHPQLSREVSIALVWDDLE